MTNCGCVNVYADYWMDEIEETNPICEKEGVVCCECQREFGIGEKYEQASCIYQDERTVYDTCFDCVSIRDEFFCHEWIYTRIHENLQEHIDGMDGEISLECLARLTPRARLMVIDYIDNVYKEISDEDEEDE